MVVSKIDTEELELPSPPLPAYWQCDLADNITWRDWDDNEVVVFSERHGHTYLLDITGWEVLSALLAARQPLSLDQLVAQLRQCFTEDTQNSDIIELLQTTLPEFHKTGLAYPTKPRD